MANLEGENEITIRDLIKASLRLRPDRIIVGEVRDAAAIDMLQAMNSGHLVRASYQRSYLYSAMTIGKPINIKEYAENVRL